MKERRAQMHATSGKPPPSTQTIRSIRQHDSGVTNLSAAFIQNRTALLGTAFILGTGIRLKSQTTTTALATGGYNFPQALTKPANSIMSLWNSKHSPATLRKHRCVLIRLIERSTPTGQFPIHLA